MKRSVNSTNSMEFLLFIRIIGKIAIFRGPSDAVEGRYGAGGR